MPLLLALIALLLTAAPAAAQAPEVTETFKVPTAGGAKIHVEVRRPAEGKAPVLLTYSPYNSIRRSPTGDAIGNAFVPKGYARASADVLGTRNSTGCWDYGGPKEIQSGVDVVRFLARQPWSTGRVAMLGGSYDGTTANMVAAQAPEGLAAIVPIAAISHWYGYAYYGGVRYLGNSQHPADEGFDTPLAFDLGFGKTPPSEPGNSEALLARAQVCDEVEHTERGYDSSPDYDAFWLERDYAKDGARVRVPTLVAHGWQDFNVKQDEGLRMFEAVSRAPWRGLFLWQGPHGSPAGPEWEALLSAFLDRFVKRTGAPLPGRIYSQSRDAATDAQIGPLATWPPPATGDLELRLGRAGTGGTLDFAGAGGEAAFTGGPTSEEMAAADPTAERGWLAYASAPLPADARIAGAPALDVTVKVNRDSAHLTPTLLDVAPDGTAVPITRGFLNLAYRDGLAAGKPLPVGVPVRAVVGFLPQDWIVRKDHRIALVLAAANTAWAVPDRPGAVVTVLHGEASRLLIPVVGAGRPDVPTAPPSIPGGRRPAEALPTDRQARRRLRVSLRVAPQRLLQVAGRAPDRVAVRLRVFRGRRLVADRTVRSRQGRFSMRVRVRRAGRHHVVALVRTREGVVSKRSRAVRVR